MSAAISTQKRTHVRVSDKDILHATRICIDLSGPDKFTMADVAREAGLTRVQIYNRFGNRDDLILALLVSHATYFAENLGKTLKTIPDTAEAIVHGMMAAVQAAQTDTYFGMLVGPATLQQETRIPGAPEAALRLSQQLWVPVLERGVEQGQLNLGLAPAEVASWIGLTQLSLLTATQTFYLSLEQCETYIRTFIVKPLLSEDYAS